MSRYTLKYFNLRARGEIARLLFAQAGVNYEDVRYTHRFEDPKGWTKIKSKLPFGKVPILEFDGQILTQSLAIAHYLAREFHLLGANAMEEGKTYEAFFTAQDIMEAQYLMFLEPDEYRKVQLEKNYAENDLPRLLGNLSTLLGNKDFFVPSGVTVGDMNVFLVTDDMHLAKHKKDYLPKLIAKYPNLTAHRNRVSRLPNIAAYLARRPHTDS
ncbi:hematopoietic prostaglandin D synthase-like [Tubulanus polymorphus]|uniref:hematopoietic prostaglandin D synthase-like n=1 Tax=Tubulanus polymorphus TaxID=672921 RepID=UPI003DA39810